MPSTKKNRMSIFGHLKKTRNGAEPYKIFCRNLTRHIARLDIERPEHRKTHVELRNLAYGHFVAAQRLIKTALKDDPVLSEFRREFASLTSDKYLQIVGLMHAYGVEKCYSDSPRTLSLLFECIAASYEMPNCITSSWGIDQDICRSARLRAQSIAEILGRPQDSARLAPSLHVVDRKILLYLAFLVREPELSESIASDCGHFFASPEPSSFDQAYGAEVGSEDDR
jgi:hypothetical protein